MRDCDPTTGRYMQADPLGLVDGASAYGYARQNPGRYTDPTGECIGPLGIICAGVVGGLGNAVIGFYIDRYFGDGCYTWDEFAFDFTLGFAFGGYGRAWGLAGNGWKYGAAAGGASRVGGAGGTARNWSFGQGKNAQKWANQMKNRNWTPKQIDEALAFGNRYPAPNNLNPANGATRFVNPNTGQSVVIDNVTKEVIHIGGPGFRY